MTEAITEIKTELTPSFDKLFSAISKFQGETLTIKKGKTAKLKGVSKSGSPFEYSYSYAELGAILEVVRPLLSKHSLCLMQGSGLKGTTIWVETILGHESGQFKKNIFTFTLSTQEASDIQKVGGAITYLRRYEINNMLGLFPADDLDGGGVGHDYKSKKEVSKPESSILRPVRATVNGSLLKLDSVDKFNIFQKGFEAKYTENIWKEKTGHKNKNGQEYETWDMVFHTHWDRVNKPKQRTTHDVFEELLKDRTMDGYDTACLYYDEHPELKENSNNQKELETLYTEVQ